jgi:hypothetical protein
MSDDLKARLREAIIHATRGRPVQFHPTYCPEAKDAKCHEWDSSHDLSVIRPDGSRYRIGTFRHSADARFDQFARELLPEALSALCELEASNEEVYAKGFAAGQDALRQLGKLVVVDSPELQELRDALTTSRAETAAVIERAGDAAEDYCSDMPDLAGHGHSVGIRDAIRAIATAAIKGAKA